MQSRISSLSYAFYVPGDSNVVWDGKAITGLVRPIGANLGWSVVDDLTEMGLPVEPAHDTPNNFTKLLLGRIDAVAMHTTIGDAYIKNNHLVGKVKRMGPPISVKPYYLALSRKWHDQHPAAARCMWQSIADQRENALTDLLERYRDTLN